MDIRGCRRRCISVRVAMIKVLGTICVILAVSAYIMFSMYKHSRDEIITLESDITRLTNIVKGYQNAEMEANITIKELREQIRSNQESTDWYNTPIPANVLDVMQKRHNRNRKH